MIDEARPKTREIEAVAFGRFLDLHRDAIAGDDAFGPEAGRHPRRQRIEIAPAQALALGRREQLVILAREPDPLETGVEIGFVPLQVGDHLCVASSP